MTDAKPGKPRLSLVMLAFSVIGLVVPAVLIAVAYRSCLGNTVRGVASVKGAGVEWRVSLGSCSAEADGHTVLLEGGNGPVVRATLDPIDGPRVEVSVPDQQVIVLTAATCHGLEVAVRPNGKRDDGSAILDGSLLISCPVPAGHPLAGARVDADAWWKACKLPSER